ncbi:class I SAM-dependent methyltransferase [Rhizomonospora bruguierae]|uniref:class I SAM-dependent methyltransferase n=1 Tax=Rhizomonospora bruguierae TaxID=1581705 RepID=UPI0020C18543|nr:class I SAM-dependent methyltransferase [Micromonospora sp. NBRC 107566]
MDARADDRVNDRDVQRLSFGGAADLYDSIRPSYPPEAVAWALGPARRRVVDLGAGTGLLTRVIARLGHDAVPVEPDPGMRARLAAAIPGSTALDGSAERIPLPPGSATGAMAGQSYHWFDREAAHAEIARVLAPGGVFAPIWNIRDGSVAWVRELWQVISPDELPERSEVDDFGPLFAPPERAEFRHVTRHTVDSLVALVKSRSYYLTASPERRAEVERATRDLVATHPDLRGRESFDLPYVTRVYRATRVTG